MVTVRIILYSLANDKKGTSSHQFFFKKKELIPENNYLNGVNENIYSVKNKMNEPMAVVEMAIAANPPPS